MSIRIASYNIHGGIGRDGRTDMARILAVLQQLDCDVVALQEVAAGPHGTPLADLAAGTRSAYLAGPTLMRQAGPYGNVLLTRLPVIDLQRIDLTVAGREPRGALVAQLECAGQPLQVVATHLGLRPAERRKQIRHLLDAVPPRHDMPGLLMGDINEWLLWGRPLRWLHARYGRTPSPPTFPAGLPLLALDRIWTHPAHVLGKLWVHRTPLTRMASDHLPIIAEIECAGTKDAG